MRRLILSLSAVICLPGILSAEERSFDIVVYGATGGGVAAAVEAGRLGKSVALIEPQKQIGGMTAGGLGATDIGSKKSITGLAKEFYHRVWKHYNDPASWVSETREVYKPKHHDAISDNLEVHWFFEPKVAEKILNGMLAEAGVKVFTGERLKRNGGVKKDEGRIVSIMAESGDVFAGKMFIDATYEGDLLADAGVSHFIGREANSDHGETLNGIRPVSKIAGLPIDPYKTPGDPSSGLLPGIEPNPPAADGSGDKRVQAYTFRLCLTDVPENRIAITKPEKYDPLVYEIHLRWILANPDTRPGKALFKLTPMPNRKTDSNNHGQFSTDFIGRSAEWAEADYARRDEIWKEHADYVRGWIWFLGNDPRVPEHIRKETLRWGLPKDEFLATDHWPFQLYVREARRMKSDYIVTEQDCRGVRFPEDGIALASYPMDSHSTARYVDVDGSLRTEGGFLVRVAPYPVSYRAIVPKKNECANLLVPVCLSATHAAYGSIRMEPVFMMLGQASAYAASLAIDGNKPVQEVSHEKVRERVGATELIAAIKNKPAGAKSGDVVSGDRYADGLARLKKAGALKGDTVWIDKMKADASVDGAKVGELLIAFASQTKPVDTVDAALDFLAAEDVLPDAKGYWRANARSGKTCSAGQIRHLVIRLGQSLD